MDLWKLLAAGLFLAGCGYYLLRMGIRSVRKHEPAIGTYDPKWNVLPGAVFLVGGMALLIKTVILPLLQRALQ